MTSRAKPILYRNVANTAWTGETARAVKRRGGAEGLLVMQYLMTCPYTTMLGVYRLVVGYMGAETALGDAGAAKGLRACIDAGFCSYDEESEFVFVHEFAKWQIGAELLPTDKRCKGVQAAYEALPDNPFLAAFFTRYSQAFNMTRRREPRAGDVLPTDLFGPVSARPSEAPSMPGADTRYQEQIPGSGTGPAQKPFPTSPAPKPAAAPTPKPATRSARAPRSDEPKPTAATWNAYATAYSDRYGEAPVRNAKVNGQLAKLVDRLGVDEAPRVAAFYVGHNRADYVRATHPVDLLLSHCEGLRTQWAKGTQTTHAQAQQADRTQTNANAFGGLLAEAAAREAQEN